MVYPARVGQEYLSVLKTRSDEGMLVCKEAVFAGAVDGRVGGRGSSWATGSRKEVSAVTHCQGSRIEEVKE